MKCLSPCHLVLTHSVVAWSPDHATGPTEGLPAHAAGGRPSVGAVARSGDRATIAGSVARSGDRATTAVKMCFFTNHQPLTTNHPYFLPSSFSHSALASS